MDDPRITQLLDEASQQYNEGEFEKAIETWRGVLALDSDNKKAREGIRMASLLVEDWHQSGGPEQKAAATPEHHGAVDQRMEQDRARIVAGISRVRQLAASGHIKEALEGCALLAEIAPDLEEVGRLRDEVSRMAAPGGSGGPAGAAQPVAAGGLEAALSEARSALAEGRNKQAADAATRALRLDPSNMEACGILSLAADDATASFPLDVADTDRHEVFPQAPGALQPEAPEGDEGPRAVGNAVAALIRDGQAALDEGRPQEAIETLSRVFAIDRSNTEAGALIDRAKAAIEEQARHLDDLFYRAVDEHEAGRLQEAKALFEQVLALSPSHPEARSYLAEIQDRLTSPAEPAGAAPASTHEAARPKKPQQRAQEEEDLFKGSSVPLALPASGAGSHHRPEEPDDDEPIRPLIEAARAGSSQGGGFKRLLAAAAGVIVVSGAGLGAYLWLGRDNGSMPEAQATLAVAPRRAAPAAPREKPTAAAPPSAIQVVPGSKPQETPPAPVDLQALKQQALELTRQGREHFQQRRWADAALSLKKAAELDPVDFDAQDLLDKAISELEKQAGLEREMGQATRYVKEGDYASALQKYYRLQQDHAEMKVFDTYIKNCWFNWGVALMQAGEAGEAVEKFDETLSIDPQDRDASRARDVARRYKGRQRDSVLDSFAATLTPRPIDQR